MARTVPFTTTAIIPIMTACIRDTAEAIIPCIRQDMANTNGMEAMVIDPCMADTIRTPASSSSTS